jgi:phosphoribosyl-AMP cyclohydrolase
MRYVPKMLTPEDNQKQREMLLKSKNEYNKGVYYTREKLASFKNKKSGHVANARKIYNIESLTPTKELALKTGFSLEALQKIVKKGEGAYFSSGSRPNQTAQSWGLARLASALTAGKSAAVDFDILEKGCKKGSKALQLANKTRKNIYK